MEIISKEDLPPSKKLDQNISILIQIDSVMTKECAIFRTLAAPLTIPHLK